MKSLTILCVTTIIILSIFTSSYAEFVQLKQSDEIVSANVMDASPERTVIRYSISGYESGTVSINGENYTEMQKLAGESMIRLNGLPQLPRINRSLIIPDNGVMRYEIVSANYIEIKDIDIAPSKGYILRTQNPDQIPYEFDDVYSRDEFYPGDLITLLEPHIFRDYRGITVELNAFQYNPVKRVLRIYTDITIEVKKTAPGGENIKYRTSPIDTIDPQFLKTYKHRFLNFPMLDYPTLVESGDMLVICYDDFTDEMEEFVDWKNQRGINTEIVPISEIGNNWISIKRYIADYYAQNSLTYVLLVGDTAQVQPVPANTGSDPMFALIEGNDLFPEVFIGRMTGEFASEVITQVERSVEYEKYPEIGGSWYQRGLGSASDEGFGCAHFGEADYQHITKIGYKLLSHTYTNFDSSYVPWGSNVITSGFVNPGVGTIFYCGHGGGQSWATPWFGISTINALENSNRLPFIINVACNTGEFDIDTCFAECWLTARDNHTGEPTGAVAAYMSRTGMGWTPGMYMEDEAAELFITDSMWTFGGLCFNGGMYMIENDPPWGDGEFKYLTVFGDPSVNLRGDYPIGLLVTHPQEYTAGTTSSNITVRNESGIPFKGLMVCLSEDFAIVASGITNVSGMVSLEWIEPLTAGQLTLTVSGGDAVPYITQVPVIQPGNVYIEIEDYMVQDDLTGNSNSLFDYYETTDLGVIIKNAGITNAENVLISISTENTFITVNDNTAAAALIAPGQSITLDRAFNITSDPSIPDAEPVIFDAVISSNQGTWETSFTIPVHAPEIVFTDLLIDDSAGGNNDSLLAPGESADLRVSLGNAGTFTGEELTVQLSTSYPGIVISTLPINIDNISPGVNARLDFSVTVGAGFSPPGQEVEFLLSVSGAHNYNGETGFSTIVGDLYRNPTGPDEYGYSAYDCYDPPFFTQYNWIELAPDSGGTGNYIHFFGLDDMEHVQLPFPFTFYGEEYDSVSICTKGYIIMGYSNEIDYTETYIPSEDGPGSFIAACWEDFDPAGEGSGGVWYEYIEEDHIFVVEYNHAPHWYQSISTHCTFETILYDPLYYPTQTGDGQIKFQYKEVFSEPCETWGAAGIENQTEDVGLSLRYQANYAATCVTFQPGTAILISTPIDTPDVAITLTPQAPPIIIPGSGGLFEFNTELFNNTADQVTFDVWFDVTMPDGSEFGPVFLRNNFSLAPSGTFLRELTQNVPPGAPAGTYTYHGKIGSYPGMIWQSDSFDFEKTGASDLAIGNNDWELYGWDDETADLNVLPTHYALRQNYPNPFNPSTTISFDLPENSLVSLEIFDITGRMVATLVNGMKTAGSHSVTFYGSDLSSGIYFVRLEAGNFRQTMKILLVK